MFENHLPRLRIRDVLHVGDQALNVQELRNRTHFLRFLVDHYGRADAAIRVAAAGNLAPFASGP